LLNGCLDPNRLRFIWDRGVAAPETREFQCHFKILRRNRAILPVLCRDPNPHYAIRWHYEQKTPGLVEGTYNALLDRALEIGAKDMLDGPPPPPPVVPAAVPPAAPVAATPPPAAPVAPFAA
jgi:hypothetical protein